MCGIAGILSTSFEQIQDGHLTKMNNAIAHRGPDGEGIWHNTKKNVLLGHRRI
jgi:asparagine synthase (glutamine-hydrolysing)